MTDMIERVARALHDADWRTQYGTTHIDGTPRTWENCMETEWWLNQARTAIEAMREPSEAMIEAGRDEFDDKVWKAMIDAALREISLK